MQSAMSQHNGKVHPKDNKIFRKAKALIGMHSYTRETHQEQAESSGNQCNNVELIKMPKSLKQKMKERDDQLKIQLQLRDEYFDAELRRRDQNLEDALKKRDEEWRA